MVAHGGEHALDPQSVSDQYRHAVIRERELSLTQRFTGVICAEEADSTGRIDRPIGDLANAWGIGRSSFADHIAALVKAGWLDRISIPGKASAYLLRIPNSDFVVSRETNSNSHSNSDGVSRETNSNVIEMRPSYTVKAAMQKLGIDTETALRYVAYLRSVAGIARPLNFIRSAKTDIRDLRGHLDDMMHSEQSSAQNVSIPAQGDIPCSMHPDYMGGNTSRGIPKCPICRKDQSN